MLTSLSLFQAQGWEKWLSRITFTRGTNSLKSTPRRILSVLPSPSACKLTVRKYIYLYLTFNGIAKANVTVFAIR